MKKTVAFLLAAALLCTLTACGGKPESSETAPASEVTEAPTTVASTTAAPTTAATTAAPTTAAPTTEAETEEETTEEEFVFETPEAMPLPAEYLSCSYAEDTAFNAEDYPKLQKKSNYSEEEADHLCEGLDDLMAFDFYEAGQEPEYYYGTSVVQMLVEEEDYGTRICTATVTTGEENLDKAMKAVGYKDYEVTYFYKFGIWAQDDEEPMPIYASLYIDDIFYDYYFIDNGLARRFGPEGPEYNPETNDFMNAIFQVGCYYGKYLAADKGRYSLMIYAPDYVYEKDGQIYLISGIMGIEGNFTFFVDEKTEFDDDCELEWFEDYKEGETPFEWYKRIIKEDEDGTAVVGVFDVKTTGQHVDKMCGCYWWD